MKAVTIAGGGLAGLSLGLALRREGVPVTLWEAGHYPRHRVCGEFISGRGLGVLEQMGLKGRLVEAGAREATTAKFWFGEKPLPQRILPRGALCLSRHVMDEVLAREFTRSGGELRQNSRCVAEPSREGLVLATGRRPQPLENGYRWLGLKMHVRDLELSADLEMHCFPDRYIGMCQLSGGVVNICGLVRLPQRRASAAEPVMDLLRGPPGSTLRTRMQKASPVERSFCSVAGLSFRREDLAKYPGCRIGDALTMIPPITGNGMSMAFESARLAAGPLTCYGRGTLVWDECRETIRSESQRLFAHRLAWASFVQAALFWPVTHGGLGWACTRAPVAWRLLFSRTR
jgi:flavin-dependent dehydrogenase